MPDELAQIGALTDGPPDADAVLILAHGAGVAADSPFMNVVARGVARAGIRLIRFEFPYMRRQRETGKRRPPNTANVLRESWLEVIAMVSEGSPLVIGGKSMGGRIASMIADECRADGLVCLGYPFHAPGKPDNPRIEHLGSLQTPALILQGERDRFGDRDDVAGYSLSAAIEVVWIKDGDHSFKPRKKSGRTEEQNLAEAVDAVIGFIRRL